MTGVLRPAISALALLAVLSSSSAVGQTANDRWQREQADRNRQAQADRNRQAAEQAQRARDDAARARQASQATRDRGWSGSTSRTYPAPPPTQRVTFAPRSVSRPSPGSNAIVAPANRNVPPGTRFSSVGVSSVVKKPTPSEERKGFTGRFSADGRALVKVQNRTYLVPASRIGVWPKPSGANSNSPSTRWSPQQQAAVGIEIQKLARAAAKPAVGGKPPGGPTRQAANDNDPSNNRALFAKFFRSSGNRGAIGDQSQGWNFNKPVNTTTLKAGTRVCQWQVPGNQKGTYFAPCGSNPSGLGIADVGHVRGGDGALVKKVETSYILNKDVVVLQGTAAAVADHWSMSPEPRKIYKPTVGGLSQYLVAFEDLGHFAESTH